MNPKSFLRGDASRALIPVLLLALLLNGCTSLSGPEQLVVGSAEITVDVPASLEILTVNGEPVTSPSKMTGSYALLLSKGKHNLEIRYSENWNSQDEAGHFIRWQPVLLSAELVDGYHYQLEYQRPSNREQAHAWADNPQIWLEKYPNKIAASATSEQASNAVVTSKTMATPMPEQANVVERLLNKTSTAQTAKAIAGDKETDQAVLTGLKFYWQQASDAERKQFLQWLQTQP